MQCNKLAMAALAMLALAACSGPAARQDVESVLKAARQAPPLQAAPAVAPVAAAPARPAAAPAPAAPTWVLINTRRPAFVVYSALDPDTSAARLSAARRNAQADGQIDLVAWDAFVAAPAEQISQRIVRNDYPEINIEQSVIELLRRYPGKLFGVTWNGGLAVTATEFKYAQSTLAQYRSNPAAVVRKGVGEDDPVYPLSRVTRMLRPARQVLQTGAQ